MYRDATNSMKRMESEEGGGNVLVVREAFILMKYMPVI